MSKEADELFTGERFVPGVEDDEITIEHYQRYETIVDIVKDKIVVDAACGEGYGSALLGKTAKQVTGIDIDAGAVKRASKNYGSSNVLFREGSIAQLPIESNSVDVLVSFETIEHVNEELQRAFITEAKRILKADGIFIISSPNKAIYSDLFNYHNEFHVHELYKDEFKALLKTQFEYVNLYNQYLEVASILDSDTVPADTAKYKKDRKTYQADGKYFIAIASNVLPKEYVLQSVYLKHQVTYRNNIKRILQLQEEEEIRNRHLKELDAEIVQKGNRIIELQNEHDSDIANYQKLDENYQRQSEELDELKEEQEIVRQELDKANGLIHDKDVHIRNLEAIIAHKDAYIGELEPGYQRWNELYTSPVGKVARLPKRVARKVYHCVKDRSSVQKLVVPECKQPLVSIVIPVYNQFDYTYNCVQSIIENSQDVAYEIIIGDDVSTDKTKNIKRYIKNITVVRNEENQRFLLNCNHAAQYAKGKYILFLNNDTKVKEEWLSSLVTLIESDPKIGMVGSKLVYPDGRLQEAGGIVWKDMGGWNYGNGQDPAMPEYNYVRECDYISGAAIMIKTDLWKVIGGFDEQFAPAYYEDTDLAFEVRKHGYKVMYQPRSVVIHYEGVSNGTDVTTGVKQYQVVNEKKFREKWKQELEKHYVNGTKPFLARERNFGDKKTVLFIDHYVPHFDKDAGSRCVFQYISLFIQKGYLVKFIGDNFYQHEPYTTILQQMGVEVLYGPWYLENIDTWLKENLQYIGYVFTNRPHISVKYMDKLREYGHPRIMYFGHDLHFLRIQREYEITHDEKQRIEAKKWKKIELSVMRKADTVYYLSTVEKKVINEIAPDVNVKTVIINNFPKFLDNINYNFKEKEGIVFVGGFAHDPNVDAMLWFIKEVYPLIRKEQEIPFYVVGSHAPDEIKELEGNGVKILGFVSDEDLQVLYSKCRIDVVPLRYGAGVKGKVIESLYNAIPLVTTSIGAEGISDIDSYVCIEDTATGFAKAVIDLYNDTERLETMARRSQEFIKKNYSTEAAWNLIKDDFS